MTRPDKQFEQLISVLCQQPRSNLAWKQAMNQLLYELQRSPELIQSSHPDYLEALHRTWDWLSRSIEQFSPQPSVPTRTSLIYWVNGYLRWRIRDLYSLDRTAPLSLDQPLGDGDRDTTGTRLDTVVEAGWTPPRLDQLDQLIEQEQQQSTIGLGQALQVQIQLDPQRQLHDCYPRKFPDCHCHLLAQKRLLEDPPLSFVALAEQLQMDKVKLTNHWYGRCLPCLQRMAMQLGYVHEGGEHHG